MKSSSLRIGPTANLVRRVQRSGSVVVCKAGAWAGYRIHWEAPQPGADFTLTSEPLVNGEAYMSPNGPFREFWITTAAGLSDPREDIELRVIDVAMPVVQLNPRRFDGFRTHTIHQQALILTHPTTLSAYSTDAQESDPASATGEILLTNRGSTIPRGWIAGGISCDTPVLVRIYANLDASISYWAEIARWYADSADGKGRFSASFEQGGRTAYSSTGTNTFNGPGLIAWPARGIEMTIQTMGADITSGWVWLASRTGPC